MTASERAVCVCTHGMTAHDYNPRKMTRTACSVLLGPRGTRCPCKTFTLAA